MTVSAQRIAEFDTWHQGRGGASVEVLEGATETLAAIYTDIALTVPAANPQTLQSKTVNGTVYGKWALPLYTAKPYRLRIASIDETGVQRPHITVLNDEVADYAVAKTARGSAYRRIIDRFDDVVHALDFGELGSSASTNTATLNAAIGAASGQGGGFVLVPPGVWVITTLTLSADVLLVGYGRSATTIQSQEAENVVTLGGDGAGLAGLTLDGVNVNVGSVGVYSLANDDTVFDDCEVKRFETGLYFKGGLRGHWRLFFIDNCDTGAKLHGDTDASGTGSGDEFSDLRWVGGIVQQCTVAGVELSWEDTHVRHNTFEGVYFKDNTGIGLRVNGARYTTLRECPWSGNTTDIDIFDDTDSSQTDNTVVGFHCIGGGMAGGIVKLDDTCQDVIFEAMRLAGITWNIVNPSNAILVRDCTEDASVTTTGDGTKLMRFRTTLTGEITGITTDATATTAWSYEIAPGQVVHARARVVANQQNDEQRAVYYVQAKAHRPGSTLAYDAQTANFTLGEIVTGGTSGATGRVVADSDAGTTGTLTLRSISGAFENNEALTGDLGGAATVNGTLVSQNAALLGAAESIGTDYESVAGWACTFDVSGTELRLRVTGAAGDNIDWQATVELVG